MNHVNLQTTSIICLMTLVLLGVSCDGSNSRTAEFDARSVLKRAGYERWTIQEAPHEAHFRQNGVPIIITKGSNAPAGTFQGIKWKVRSYYPSYDYVVIPVEGSAGQAFLVARLEKSQ